MAQSKHEFFEKGVVNQSTPSILINIKIPDLSKVENWNLEQKKEAKQFTHIAKLRFKELIKELEDCL